jgi:putative ABC transport system permease protein
VSDLRSDVRYAFRTLSRRPGFALVVGLTLAVGVGLNATVFAMMDAMLLRPFRFPDQHWLVIVWDVVRDSTGRDQVAPATYLDWRAQASTFESLAAWEWWDATVADAGIAERLQGFTVSPGFFELLGASPAAGRSFAAGEEQPGHHRVVVIGNGWWRQRFGADPEVVGRDLVIGDEPYTIVGIAPPGFDFPVGAQIWAALALTPERGTDRHERTLTVAAKLASGRSIADAQSEMDVVSRRLEQQYPVSRNEPRSRSAGPATVPCVSRRVCDGTVRDARARSGPRAARRLHEHRRPPAVADPRSAP